MFKSLSSIRLIVDIKTVFVTALALTSMVLCERFKIRADFPLTLISTAIIFPIVFSIGGAYKRREAALAQYGNIKAHGRAIYFAVRDWLPEADSESQTSARNLLGELMRNMRTLFTGSKEETVDNELAVYGSFAGLSRFCLLYTSPSPRDLSTSRMPSSA